MPDQAARLLAMMEGLERTSKSTAAQPNIIKTPFSYPGGKSRSLRYVLPHLPVRDLYCEPFGGSAAILLARDESRLEIYNDAYGGVVSFYRCMRDKELFEKLVTWLELTVNSREEFWNFKDTWRDQTDDVERAGRWYFVSEYSFGSLSRNWGRARGGKYTGVNGRIRRKLKHFQAIHERFTNVQVENRDGIECMREYDVGNAVFYVDPPYNVGDQHVYEHSVDHVRLLDTIFDMKGFVALSGYENDLYDSYPWTATYDWEVRVSIEGHGNKIKKDTRPVATEKLWIKESIGRR